MSAIKLIAERARQIRTPGTFSNENLPSPCVSVCRMDAASELCEGCLRTLDEIAAWGLMDDQGKRAVWIEIERRASGVQQP